jgi:hypothetical protein
MVDLQASLDQQFMDIAIRKRVAKVPTDGTEDDRGCEMPPFEDHQPLRLRHHLSSVPA